MWKYEKKLEYPVNIRKKDLKMAQNLLAQYGGTSSEMTAFITYLNQRYTMPDDRGRALLTDIATEEQAHSTCRLYSKKIKPQYQIIILS